MTLAEILASKDIPDDTEFSIKDTKFKFGDLRAFNDAAVKSDEAAKERRRQAEELAQQAANLLAQLQETPPPADDRNKAFDWESDPIFSPLKPILRPLIDGASAYEKKVADLAKVVTQLQGIYALRELQRQWDGYQARLKGKNVTFEQAVQETIRRKAVDTFGIPTLEPFVQELTAPDREAAARADERAKADAEWQKKLDAATKAGSMPRPGASIRTAEKRGGQPPIKRIEELTSEVVANDEDITKLVSGGVQ